MSSQVNKSEDVISMNSIGAFKVRKLIKIFGRSKTFSAAVRRKAMDLRKHENQKKLRYNYVIMGSDQCPVWK